MSAPGSQFNLNEDDIVLLEALIKSPVFGAMKRMVSGYKAVCDSELRAATDTHRLFQIQGRLIGLEVVTNLPEILVRQRQARIDKAAEVEKKKQITRPKLPPIPPSRKSAEKPTAP